ncbi:MAG: hypothetical protein JJ714_05530, partial [Acidithiobacillus sp.]|nr:hypothetical protein [Acidithiobacillus sp.]
MKKTRLAVATLLTLALPATAFAWGPWGGGNPWSGWSPWGGSGYSNPWDGNAGPWGGYGGPG